MVLLWTKLNPIHPRMLCAKFGWNWPSGSGEEVENRKSLQTDRQTDRRTDGQTTDERRSEKLTWAFSSGELIKNWYSAILYTHEGGIGINSYTCDGCADKIILSWSPQSVLLTIIIFFKNRDPWFYVKARA